MLIKVTQEHIERGGHRSHSCPIALALKEQGWNDVNVLPEVVVLGLADIPRDLPEPARTFIRSFDHDGPDSVAPFEFELKT